MKNKPCGGYDSRTIAHFKIKLLAERVILIEKTEMEKDSFPLKEECADFETCKKKEAFALYDANAAMDLEHLRAIEAALCRCENGTYGLCEICGVKIDINRLEKHPSFSQCVPCHKAYISSGKRIIRGSNLRVTA